MGILNELDAGATKAFAMVRKKQDHIDATAGLNSDQRVALTMDFSFFQTPRPDFKMAYALKKNGAKRQRDIAKLVLFNILANEGILPLDTVLTDPQWDSLIVQLVRDERFYVRPARMADLIMPGGDTIKHTTCVIDGKRINLMDNALEKVTNGELAMFYQGEIRDWLFNWMTCQNFSPIPLVPSLGRLLRERSNLAEKGIQIQTDTVYLPDGSLLDSLAERDSTIALLQDSLNQEKQDTPVVKKKIGAWFITPKVYAQRVPAGNTAEWDLTLMRQSRLLDSTKLVSIRAGIGIAGSITKLDDIINDRGDPCDCQDEFSRTLRFKDFVEIVLLQSKNKRWLWSVDIHDVLQGVFDNRYTTVGTTVRFRCIKRQSLYAFMRVGDQLKHNGRTPESWFARAGVSMDFGFAPNRGYEPKNTIIAPSYFKQVPADDDPNSTSMQELREMVQPTSGNLVVKTPKPNGGFKSTFEF